VDPEINEDSRGIDPKLKGYKSGTIIKTMIFGSEKQYDGKYYTFGPFNPAEGDYSERWGYIFKFICDGISGDDGNLYKYFLSREANSNVPIEKANAFTYEYTFRMWNDFKSVAHIYPYVDTGVIFIKVRNYDWDNDGNILVVSRYKQGIPVKISNEDNWVDDRITIEPPEIGSSLDFQFHKEQRALVKNNNVVVTIESQRGDALPFFSSPIGGIPVYTPKISVNKYIKPK
jgi:hypothetical protein